MLISILYLINCQIPDDLIYEYLEGKNNNLLNKIELDRNECLQVFNEYDEENRTIY